MDREQYKYFCVAQNLRDFLEHPALRSSFIVFVFSLLLIVGPILNHERIINIYLTSKNFIMTYI